MWKPSVRPKSKAWTHSLLGCSCNAVCQLTTLSGVRTGVDLRSWGRSWIAGWCGPDCSWQNWRAMRGATVVELGAGSLVSSVGKEGIGVAVDMYWLFFCGGTPYELPACLPHASGGIVTW